MCNLRVHVSSKQRLVWSQLLQWLNLIFIFFVVIQLAMATGLWIVSSQVKPFLQGHNPHVLPSLILSSSILTIVMATVGYNGALHSASPNIDERFLSLQRLMWFELLGTLVGVLCIVLGVTGFTVVHGDILWAADRGLKSFMSHYSSTPAAKEKMDRLQATYKCCGAVSYRDWFAIPWQKYSVSKSGEVEDSVPWSCCSPESPRPCVHFSVTQNIVHKAYTYPGDLTLHSQGCVAAITTYLGHHMFYICGGLLLFLGCTLMAIVLWTRLLETSIANAYRIGDPDCSTWGYFFINYGPDIEDLYDELDQTSDEEGHGESTYRSYDDDTSFVPDSDLGEDDSDEEVIAVSSPIDLPSALDVYSKAGTESSEGQTTTSQSTITNENNNRSPNNNDTLLQSIQDANCRKSKNKRSNQSKRQDTASFPAPLPPPPYPPPLPAELGVKNDAEQIPPLPPLPFQ